MSDLRAFRHMSHTPAFWQANKADRTALFAPYTSSQAADVTPVNAYQLGLLALQEMVHLELALAHVLAKTALLALLEQDGEEAMRKDTVGDQ